MFGQAQGGAVFAASITTPDGTIILDPDSSPSPYLISILAMECWLLSILLLGPRHRGMGCENFRPDGFLPEMTSWCLLVNLPLGNKPI